MSRRILITGISGFVGSCLAEEYVRRSFEVHGTVRERSDLSNLHGIKDSLHLHEADVTDPGAVERLVALDFNTIHHLAALTYVPTSWESPAAVTATNALGTLNFLEALRNRRSASLFHFAGTCEEYGTVLNDELPIKETNPLRPTSPYAISKLAADLLCQTYQRAFQVRTVVTRAFNHTGTKRGGPFVTRTICRQAAEIKKGQRDAFELGNVTAQRDWTDVRDICLAYAAAAQYAGTKIALGQPYNVCSGKAYSIRQIVAHIAQHAGIPPNIVSDKSKLRPVDNMVFLGDPSKFRQATGWAPQRDVLKTLEETYQLELVALGGGGLDPRLPVPPSGFGSR